MKKITWKGFSIAVVMAAAVIYVLPTLCNDCWPHKKINLGLDLQGGMHLVLDVQTEKAVETTIERTIHEIKQELRKKEIKHLGVTHNPDNTLSIQLQNQTDLDQVNPLITDEFGNYEVEATRKDGEKRILVLRLPREETTNIKKMATDQALETIRNRIDAFGVSEPDIRLQGENRIQVQLPGIQDTQRAKELIGRTARLNFQLVDETGDVKSA